MPLLNEQKSEEEKTFALKWYSARNFVKNNFGQRPDINAMLFIIGMNELGRVKEEWSKEENQDLMHIAVCTLLEEYGYYEFQGKDEDGWPHWKSTEKLPSLKPMEQERLIKQAIVLYFEKNRTFEN